ncbi:dTMP kinase [bacterium]|uniref:Thymidylate kinase n=2 Tax=Katanobacteria TaxID=422282 RepID=A0A2M7X3R2_UNCKA|nr:dTMP kinase [bacterium]PIP56051.1 MAG: dTMP kinase [candidate division WWE3 bacterium CG22_combo_CG10-13_8_21_14_all_39_12]PJA40812.1 MAG: dTMP kinase [candidate division WWE3 bacterium CG_4_9_14_3_um_filter_39_7]
MYVALDGLGGSGKSEQTRRLVEWLISKGIDATGVREPGSDPVAELIRNILLSTTDLVPLADAYGYAAARAQMLSTVVRPILDRGGWVITDRFAATSCSFQGHLQGLGVRTVIDINSHLFDSGLPFPDLVLFIDVPPHIALERFLKRTGSEFDKFDDGDLDTLTMQREGYFETFRHPPYSKNVLIIDGNQSIDKVHADIVTAIQPYTQRLA